MEFNCGHHQSIKGTIRTHSSITGMMKATGRRNGHTTILQSVPRSRKKRTNGIGKTPGNSFRTIVEPIINLTGEDIIDIFFVMRQIKICDCRWSGLPNLDGIPPPSPLLHKLCRFFRTRRRKSGSLYTLLLGKEHRKPFFVRVTGGRNRHLFSGHAHSKWNGLENQR